MNGVSISQGDLYVSINKGFEAECPCLGTQIIRTRLCQSDFPHSQTAISRVGNAHHGISQGTVAICFPQQHLLVGDS